MSIGFEMNRQIMVDGVGMRRTESNGGIQFNLYT